MKIEDFENKMKGLPEILSSDKDEQLAEQALEKIRSHSKSGRNWFQKRWCKVIICCAALLIVAIPLSIVFWPADDGGKNYLMEDVEAVKYSSIAEYNQVSGLSLLNLSVYNAFIDCEKYQLRSNGQIAYLMEKVLIDTPENYDDITLSVIPSKNTFEVFSEYDICTLQMEFQSIQILYNQTLQNDIFQCILAKFRYNNYQYYLKILTIDEEGLTNCLSKLFSV